MTATVGIDPRIQARRTKVRRAAGHRRLRRLRGVGAILAGFAVAFALTRSPAMDVDHVRVRADGIDAALVREAAGVSPGEPMTGVDPTVVAGAVAALAEVESVEVRRSWPNAVTIDVIAAVPGVAVPAVGGGWLIADRAGRIMAVTDERPPDLLPIDGVELVGTPGQVMAGDAGAAAEVGAALPDDLRDRADRVGLAEGGLVEVHLTDGGSIVFDVEVDLPAAAAAAAAVAATVPPGCVDRIDVLSPSAPVLRRADIC